LWNISATWSAKFHVHNCISAGFCVGGTASGCAAAGAAGTSTGDCVFVGGTASGGAAAGAAGTTAGDCVCGIASGGAAAGVDGTGAGGESSSSHPRESEELVFAGAVVAAFSAA
jgi:hypothetical protein